MDIKKYRKLEELKMFGLILGIVFAVLFVGFWIAAVVSYENGTLFGWLCVVFLVLSVIGFISINFTGLVNYEETNDYDRARITAVDTVQTPFRTYYKVDVEYLTNTPTQQGIVTNLNIEKDTYFTYDIDLVKTLRENMYRELIITSGFKGGYETWRDFRGKLIKGIELLEVTNE